MGPALLRPIMPATPSPNRMSLRGRDVISIRDLSKEDVLEILASARKMIPFAEGKKVTHPLEDRIVAMAFFEPSTRTRLSFEAAVQRLGGRCITIADAAATSMRKGESLSDTVQMLTSYSDAIVIRHPNEGSAQLAARVSPKPIINAGDGAGQHPTQTLADLATMQEAFGTLTGLKVVLLGDLRYGRTVHSLAYALAVFGAEIVLTSPPELRLPRELFHELEAMGARVTEEADVRKAVRDADVLYVTRIQKERFGDEGEYRKVAGSYRIDRHILGEAKPRLVILHPLPRAGEILPEVDSMPHASYFRQAFLAVPVRMALLSAVLSGGRGE
jgi:aspartate carbamoyltransferase catalytic subunit